MMTATTFRAMGIVSLALLFSACNSTPTTNTATTNNATTNTSTTTVTKNANTAVVVNSNQTTTNTAPAAKPTPSPANDAEASEVQGELQVGKTESVILYVGMESGDYAAYCFTNDSEAGRAILAACKNGEQCKVKGTIADYNCKVPGLEADLSSSGKIATVTTAKSLGRKK